eukprot:m.96595 g.96595  ORF g.96595 m.96595 type:complete len:213 (+) comp13075_c0_seq13:1238-1876(+)
MPTSNPPLSKPPNAHCIRLADPVAPSNNLGHTHRRSKYCGNRHVLPHPHHPNATQVQEPRTATFAHTLNWLFCRSQIDLSALLRQHEKQVMANVANGASSRVAQTSGYSSYETSLVHVGESAVSPVLAVSDELKPNMLKSVVRKGDSSYIFCTEVQVMAAENSFDAHKLSVVIPTTSHHQDDAVPPQLMRIDCDVVNRELLPIVNATNVIHP